MIPLLVCWWVKQMCSSLLGAEREKVEGWRKLLVLRTGFLLDFLIHSYKGKLMQMVEFKWLCCYLQEGGSESTN